MYAAAFVALCALACAKHGPKSGVPECDAYEEKFEACLGDLSDDERAQRAPEAEAQRKVLRDEAASTEGRARVAESCRAALASLQCP